MYLYQRPDSILVLHVIEDAQLPRHRDRHVQQASLFSRTFESETCAKRRHVVESGHFHPLKIGRLSAHERAPEVSVPVAHEFVSNFVFTHGR